MKISSLKELQKLILLCRKTGIEAIEVDGVKMNLGPTPVIIQNKRTKPTAPEQSFPVHTPGGITEEVQIPTNGLTEEQLLYYSSGSNNEQQ